MMIRFDCAASWTTKTCARNAFAQAHVEDARQMVEQLADRERDALMDDLKVTYMIVQIERLSRVFYAKCAELG